MSYKWDFSAIFQNWHRLLEGFSHTLLLALCALCVGVVVGVICALLKTSRFKVLRLTGIIYIEFYRNTPAIIHFFWFYYALPIVVDISISPFQAAILALATQSGAFYAEVFRGGVQSIPKGQWEGALAIGMNRLQAMRRVILPQAVRRMIAPFLERTFEIVKSTSLAATLAYSELLFEAMQLSASTYRPLEIYTTLAVIYFTLLFILSSIARRIESRMKVY